jgi:hypothetical protein
MCLRTGAAFFPAPLRLGAWGRLLVFGLALAATAGCLRGRGSAPVPQGERYVILADELKATNRLNLFDAVRQVRHFWFTPDRHGSTGQGISVYLDGQLIGGPSSLSRLSTDHVERVRYISASEAQLRFGNTNGLRPAILVESQRR